MRLSHSHVVCLVFLAACGGQVTGDLGATGPGGGASASGGGAAGAAAGSGVGGTVAGASGAASGTAGTGAAGAFAGAAGTTGDPCLVGTTHLCESAGCKKCPAGGCVPMFDAQQGYVGGGSCSDILDAEPFDCAGCFREACVLVSDLGEPPAIPILHCADTEMCERLRTQGFEQACRYTDRSPYDGPLDGSTSCVATSTAKLCGGACGGCDTGNHCSFRSKERPLGVCIPDKHLYCGITDVCSNADTHACLAFPQAPGLWHESAIRNGVCIPTAECIEVGQVLPGGAVCFQTTNKGVDVLSGSFSHP